MTQADAPELCEALSGVDETLAILDTIDAAVDAFHTLDLFRLSADERLAVSRRLEVVARRVNHVQVVMAGEHDLARDAATHGATSTAAMLAQVLNISRGEAGRRVRLAGQTCDTYALSGDLIGAPMPELARALQAGRISGEHARIIVSTRYDPTITHLDPAVLDQVEQVLVERATAMEPATLAKVATKIIDTVNPDGMLDRDGYDPAAHAELHIGSRDGRTGLSAVTGKLDDEGVEILRRAIDGLAAPRPEHDGVKDLRSAATRRAHALVGALRRLLDAGRLPEQHQTRPHITVTMTLDQLLAQRGRARLLEGIALSVAQTRRLLCDAEVLPVVLGGAGEVLDVGRASRTATVAIRRAVTARDQGCAFPGCDRPPDWADFHHLTWWARGGVTSVDNGCLLCPAHHGEVHREHWKVKLGPDRLPQFIPPAWIDPAQQPLRNTMHDPPLPTRQPWP